MRQKLVAAALGQTGRALFELEESQLFSGKIGFATRGRSNQQREGGPSKGHPQAIFRDKTLSHMRQSLVALSNSPRTLDCPSQERRNQSRLSRRLSGQIQPPLLETHSAAESCRRRIRARQVFDQKRVAYATKIGALSNSRSHSSFWVRLGSPPGAGVTNSAKAGQARGTNRLSSATKLCRICDTNWRIVASSRTHSLRRTGSGQPRRE